MPSTLSAAEITEFAAGVHISGAYPDSDFDPTFLLKQSVFAFHVRNDVTEPVGTTKTVVNWIINAAYGPFPNYPAPGTSGDFFVSNSDLSSHQALEATIGHVRGLANFSLAGSGIDLAYYEYITGGHAVFFDGLQYTANVRLNVQPFTARARNISDGDDILHVWDTFNSSRKGPVLSVADLKGRLPSLRNLPIMRAGWQRLILPPTSIELPQN